MSLLSAARFELLLEGWLRRPHTIIFIGCAALPPKRHLRRVVCACMFVVYVRGGATPAVRANDKQANNVPDYRVQRSYVLRLTRCTELQLIRGAETF